mmetsp:Transcript_53297/g.117026  ORF Transcript_53297/g.117026 Transcript_53297/m.117026 type:complete len:151 (+) Transcript_53297:53-505(+)
MDNHSSAIFAESLKKERTCADKWLQDLDLTDAKEIPPESIYQSTSIAQQPLDSAMVQPAVGFKPVQTKANFERAKMSYGFVYPARDQELAKDDPRPPCQIFRNTGKPDEVDQPMPPNLFRGTEYYGRTRKCYEQFYRPNGAFSAQPDRLS